MIKNNLGMQLRSGNVPGVAGSAKLNQKYQSDKDSGKRGEGAHELCDGTRAIHHAQNSFQDLQG